MMAWLFECWHGSFVIFQGGGWVRIPVPPLDPRIPSLKACSICAVTGFCIYKILYVPE